MQDLFFYKSKILCAKFVSLWQSLHCVLQNRVEHMSWLLQFHARQIVFDLWRRNATPHVYLTSQLQQTIHQFACRTLQHFDIYKLQLVEFSNDFAQVVFLQWVCDCCHLSNHKFDKNQAEPLQRSKFAQVRQQLLFLRVLSFLEINPVLQQRYDKLIVIVFKLLVFVQHRVKIIA